MLPQQKGSYPTRPKYLLFAAKLWNKFVDICCQHVQKGCGLLLPKLKANMWTICCQNARICGLLLSKLTTNMWTTCCQNVRKFADCCCKMERKCVDIRHFFRGKGTFLWTLGVFFGWTIATFLWTWGRLNSFILWEYGWRFASLEGMSIDSSRTPQYIILAWWKLQVSLKFHGGEGILICHLNSEKTPSQFEVPWGWEFWYHLNLVGTPSQFKSSMGVGILISS